MTLDEFSLIDRYFKRANGNGGDVVLGIGDDAALVRVSGDESMVIAVDTLVRGVHFAADAAPYGVGHKALAVSLSDLAAMGAEPRWATLALTLPEVDEPWLQAFSDGLFSLCDRFDVALIGGDTTRGPLTVTVQVAGVVPEGQVLRRAGAKVGDLIWVTGSVGDAGLALAGPDDLPDEHGDELYLRLHQPTPRVGEGIALRGLATAAIDISDGLAADLGHLLRASNVGATISGRDLPLSTAVRRQVLKHGAWHLPLSSGDDYELCFTTAPGERRQVMQRFHELGCNCRCIGEVEQHLGLRARLSGDETEDIEVTGYRHFG